MTLQRSLWRSLWREPRPGGAAPIGRLDWLLVGAFAMATVLEGILRPGLAWRPVVIVLALALIPALLGRRHRPLLAVLVGWGVAAILAVLQISTNAGDLGIQSMLAVLILLYALVRWGSGREMLLGSAAVVAVVALGMFASATGWAEVFGGTVLILLVIAVGAVFRYRADLWRRQQNEIRNQERVALARELHDTVAHHVSAIAVQAQAAGVVARSQPDQVVAVLSVIEAEASRTLAEMRSMVQLLRDDESVEYSPQATAGGLLALARSDGIPTVEVSLHGLSTPLPTHVDATIYRIAQESLTNAVRHAHGATNVEIEVRRDGEVVRLRVADDGQSEPPPGSTDGYGLIGMAERANLLGGSFQAGPAPGGGWVVEAVLPVRASA